MLKLRPPFRFGIVCCSYSEDSQKQKQQETVYRGAYPSLKNFRFLCRLGLKTIISLVPPDKVTQDVVEFCEGNEIKHHVINPGSIDEILLILTNTDSLPAYVHCVDGANKTGMVIACLRTLQHWNMSAIVSEFSRYTKKKIMEDEDKAFVSMYNPRNLEIPRETAASWLPAAAIEVPSSISVEEDTSKIAELQ
mmetsp:Transcript_533/g.633  ORF Transcript_533/g.633 Transcript_533/m.633 type:complete len:193 (-) Transcript_533:435-1013(-)